MLEPQSMLRDAGGGFPSTTFAPLLARPPLLSEPSPATVGSPEITDEEIGAATAACCRICLESESEPGDELISPCMCKGTQQFVHRSCLDHWRSVKEGTAFSHCTTCKARFHLRVECLEDDICRRMKFRLFVARDVILVFLVIQAVRSPFPLITLYCSLLFIVILASVNCKLLAFIISLSESLVNLGYYSGHVFEVCISFALFQAIAAIGGMAYLLDKDGNFRNRFSDDWEQFLSKLPVPFYYCVGVVVFFVLVGFFGLIVHLSSFNNNDPCLAGCHNGCYGWGIAELPASIEACFAFAVIFVIIFAILGVAYSFLAATLAIQRIWQRHYHILTKKELTKASLLEVTLREKGS